MRRFITGLLILLSALSLFASSLSLWTRHNVINTGVFVSNVETIADLPQVEARVNQQVTATVMTNPQVQDAIDNAMAVLPPRLQQFRPTVENGIQSLISAGVQRLLTNDPFRPLTSAALTSAHTQLVNGQPVRFTLGQAKDRIPASARTGLAGQVLDLIPDDVGFTVVTPADAPQLYNAIDLLKSAWWWFGLIALGCFAGAIGISRHRRRTVRAWSVTASVLLLVQLLALRIARGQLVAAAKPENRDALGAAYDVVAQSLRGWTLWLLAFTLVLLAVTLLWGRLGIIPGIRRGWHAARTRIAERREAHRAAAAVEQPAAEGAPTAQVAGVQHEPWPRRVAADTRAFVEGLGLDEQATRLGVLVRDHRKPLQWTGIVLGVLVLLAWPSPTLSVLIWIAAVVTLYVAVLEWLERRAPEEPAEEAAAVAPQPPPATEAPTAPAVPAARSSADGPASPVPASRGPANGAPGSTMLATRPAETQSGPVSGEDLTNLSDRVDLLIRLGAARDSGLLSEEEFQQQKGRLLVG